MGLLDGGLKDTIKSALSGLALDFVLTKETLRPGENEWNDGAKIKTDYTVKGFTVDYNEKQIDGTIIQRGDRQILLLAGTCTVRPDNEDSITAEGKKYRVKNVKTDPAGATYILQVR